MKALIELVGGLIFIILIILAGFYLYDFFFKESDERVIRFDVPTCIFNISSKNGNEECYETKRLKEFLNLWENRDISPHGIKKSIYRENENSVKFTFDERVGIVPGLFNGIDFSSNCPSESMLPAYPCNSLAIVYKPKSMDEIFIGDIVLANVTVAVVDGIEQFQYFEHRVIEKNDDSVCIQADNLDYVGYEKNCGIKFNDIFYKVIGVIY